MRQNPLPVELIAAPILSGERYQGRPIYFSDVIVRADRRLHSFADLRGHSWSYNDVDSHSGYNVTRARLIEMGETDGFFSAVVEAGSHQRSIEMVLGGSVEASAIDSQVLAIELRDNPEAAHGLKIIDSLGPSTIQPVVASLRLSPEERADIRRVLLEMHRDPQAQVALAYGFVERFAPVVDETYDDIRRMLAAAESAGFRELR